MCKIKFSGNSHLKVTDKRTIFGFKKKNLILKALCDFEKEFLYLDLLIIQY